MLSTRLTALSLLLAVTLPACDSKSEPADDDGDDEQAAEVDDEQPPVLVEDFGRAGEACDQSVLSAACQIEGVAGAEFCIWDVYQYTYEWSACLTEACSEPDAQRTCDDGVQFCATLAADVDREDNRWGVCGEAGECEPGETRQCFPGDDEGGGWGDIMQGCGRDAYGRAVWNSGDCDTPLVLSFGDEIAYEPAPVAAAAFEIGGGMCSRADWPTAQTPWLALDRDGNGSIDGGRELFGSATRLAAGTGPHNGFHALAELDSDGDGKLSPADARWPELVVWADHDADRRSSGWEMLPLRSFAVVEIDLGYGVRRDCDERGNCGLERAAFVYQNTNGQARVGEVVDVHLACE